LVIFQLIAFSFFVVLWFELCLTLAVPLEPLHQQVVCIFINGVLLVRMCLLTVEKACEVQSENKTHLVLSARTQVFITLRVFFECMELVG
jgi:hypothetical protein